MTEELDAVIFDAGGTLWDMVPRKEELIAQALAMQGVQVERADVDEAVRAAERRFDEDFAKLLDPLDEAGFWHGYDRFILDRLGVRADLDRFAADTAAEFRAVVDRVESWQPYPDAIPTLQELRSRDVKVGLVSNATDLARKVLRNLDMERYFDSIIISSEVGFRKPQREIFQMAVDRAGTSPGRALYIGDRLATDVKGARRAGLNAILLDRGDVYPDADVIRARDLATVRRFL
jgi:putative hydrolase of the HAD superfamily